MQERTGIITFQGGPLTLCGTPVAPGQTAPDFSLLANDLSTKTLADYAGNILILSTVPSLETSVCDTETRTFNEVAVNLTPNIKVLTISADLPFAQQRWCAAAGVERVETLSDHQNMNFAEAYGLHIKELRLLARAVLVVDTSGTIVYQEVVPEVTTEPNYEGALKAAQEAG